MEIEIVDIETWKKKIHKFNQEKLNFVESVVREMIPWMVLFLFLMIVGEFAHEINWVFTKMGFSLGFLVSYGNFIEHYHGAVLVFDFFVIMTFVAELYFEFFKHEEFLKFLKANVLNIIAVIPVGLLMEGAALTTSAQQATHATMHSTKAVGRTTEIFKTASRSTKILRLITRLPRLVRLYRLRDFFRKN